MLEILIQLFFIIGGNSQCFFNCWLNVPISIRAFHGCPDFAGVLLDYQKFSHEVFCGHLLNRDQLVSVFTKSLEFVNFYSLLVLLNIAFTQEEIKMVFDLLFVEVPCTLHTFIERGGQI